MATTEVRPVRGCDVCGGVDDHPRHVFGTDHRPDIDSTTDVEVGMKMLANAPDEESKAAILRHIQDVNTQMRHMDCCRAAGCPTGECYTVTAGAEDVRGKDLLAHIQGSAKQLAKAAAERDKQVMAQNEALAASQEK